ncbi:MAG: sigma-70 family RNA polymerase sigma factor [Lachnospiraceae bacterium]|nr:sigma-70 family RNA polymerase sigma factor [Lachnospiraceae bacterium]
MKILYCPKCGAEIKNYYIYCGVCGEPLRQVSDKDEKLFQIADEIKSGDMSHFDEFYTLTYPLIKGVFSQDNYKDFTEEDREDLIQETYAAVYSKITTLQDVRSIKGWITTVATSIALNQMVKQNAKKRQADIVYLEPDEEFDEDPLDNIADEEAESIESLVENKEVRGFIKEALDSIPEEQRTVLLAVYMGGMKQAEVAATLGLNENTVKTRISRGKKKLQIELEKIEKKQNIRLHSFAPIPLLYLYFRSQLANVQVSAAEAKASYQGVVKAVTKAAKSAPRIPPREMKINPQPFQEEATQAPKAAELPKANIAKEGMQASENIAATASKSGTGTKLAATVAKTPIKTLVAIGAATAAVSIGGYAVLTVQDHADTEIAETVEEEAFLVSQDAEIELEASENADLEAATEEVEETILVADESEAEEVDKTIYSLSQLTDEQISEVMTLMDEYALDTSWEYDYVDSTANDLEFTCEPYAIVVRTVNISGIKRTEFVYISRKTLTMASSDIYDLVYYDYNLLRFVKIKDDGSLEYTKQNGYDGEELSKATIYAGGFYFSNSVKGFTEPAECIGYKSSYDCYTEQWNYINGDEIIVGDVVTITEEE